MQRFTLSDVRERTYKGRDSWWTVLLVDPLASRLVRITANRTSVTPNQLTLGALVLGLAAAVCFAMADWPWLLAGAVLFHFSFVLDCMDGKIARLKGTGSLFGTWLDYVFDRLRVLICAVALAAGQFAATGDAVFLWVALAVVFLDMFRYLNALQVAKVRGAMRGRLKRSVRELRRLLQAEAAERSADADAAQGGSEVRARIEELARRLGAHEPVPAELMDDADTAQEEEAEAAEAAEEFEATADAAAGAPAVRSPITVRGMQATALQQRFHSRFPWYARVRDALRRRRIRPHLVSGIEFQMGVFIVAPLLGMFSAAAIPVTVAVVGALLLAFELVIIYKLWLSTRDFQRACEQIDAALAELTERRERYLVGAPGPGAAG
ncbi:CDP-alcohol phosphatidyltransferase family protein [Allonocardiopsis opalescens]|uniref:CDP-alcohol phosphatidyltransferase-like enzyme n=1 Tax=Allonocardiopsis opalescens TaxID=1144618 RepID=A0A2T0PW64_9ACTN|nr:CDP-alcohol phosphatidyltransferase family protein [Allonocardiopsis opalescens]PRX95763.1 CDP-alcohol phosphatidyltransferase-like enzyme [Allonocardiopsis opalescens]